MDDWSTSQQAILIDTVHCNYHPNLLFELASLRATVENGLLTSIELCVKRP